MPPRLPRRCLLEVAVGSVADVRAASAGGADRLELNAALSLGGLTPTAGLLAEVLRATKLPVIAMIRPRAGGFAYDRSDFLVLCRDLEAHLAAGATGVAFGVLRPDGGVDRRRCREAVRLADGAVTVFHRAFDATEDLERSLEELIDLGVTRIMTSGGEASAYNGAARIRRLARQARGRIEVLPAGGINRFTAADVLARTGCDQVHAGLRAARRDPSLAAAPHLRFGALPVSEDSYDVTSRAEVESLAALLRRLARRAKSKEVR
jgi:copper homeostasis protein